MQIRARVLLKQLKLETIYFKFRCVDIVFLGGDRAGLNDYLPRFCSNCSNADPRKGIA